jgi:hypothetical protein
MTCLVFLLEEPSAKDLLQGLVPRLPWAGLRIQYLVFEGKQDLERQLVRKLRSWLALDSVFVVLRDQDAADCVDVKNALRDLVAQSGRERVLVRVACHELESWVIGDWHAVAQAFEKPQLSAQAQKAIYRQPDRLANPLGELRKFLPEYQKRDGARRVGVLLDPDRNQSHSFRAFWSGLNGLLGCGDRKPT